MPESRSMCSVKNCEKPRHARGLCQMHNRRRHVTGAPLVKSLHSQTDHRIRWIDDHAGHVGDECLIWPFAAGDRKRGILRYRGKVMSAPKAMCLAAHGEPPTAKHESAHSCGKGHLGCVHPGHLSWKTRKENRADLVKHGVLPRGTMVSTNKLSEDQVRDIRSRIASETGMALAAEFGVTGSCISDIKQRKSWAWLE